MLGFELKNVNLILMYGPAKNIPCPRLETLRTPTVPLDRHARTGLVRRYKAQRVLSTRGLGAHARKYNHIIATPLSRARRLHRTSRVPRC
jgi:hypothetical protein